MTYSLGIDLGTTYTAAATVRAGRAEVATLGYRATSVPTVVVLTDDGTVVVGDAAERRGAAHPQRLAREFKRRVGDPTPVLLGGTPVSVDRLLAEVLRFVARSVGETEGAAPASTVVTHPANWGPFKRDVLEQAIRLAGLEGATLLPEPVAAVTWYAQAERLAPGATVAVYDLGGGTFDTAVLEMGRDGSFAVRGRPEGVERLGGVDVDAAVVGHVLRSLGSAAARLDPTDPATSVSMARLRSDCVEAKEALSSETTVTIPVNLPGIHDEVLLRRTELEELVAPVLAPTVDALRRAVASAGLGPGQPDAVLLVGGSSRMPLVAREVSVALGRPVAVDAHPKHPVALGAALVAESRRPAVASRAAPVDAQPGQPGRPVAAVGVPPARPTDAPGRRLPPPPPPRHPPAGMPPSDRPAAPPPSGGRRSRRSPAVGAALSVLALVAAGVGVRVATSALADDDPLDTTTSPTSVDADATAPVSPDDTDGPELLFDDVDLSEAVGGAPATDGTLAYVVDDTARVTAFDLASGTQAWQADIGDAASSATPVLAGGRLIVSASEPSAVKAFDPATGVEAWTVTDLWASDAPVIVGDNVVVSSGSTVTALRISDGGVAWSRELEVSLWSGLELSPAGDLLVASTTLDNQLVALRADGSGVAWTADLPRHGATVWDVAIMGDTVIAVDDDGFVNLVALTDGSVRHSLDLEARFFDAPAPLGTAAVVALDSGELLVFDPATGAERARLPDAPGTMLALPGDQPLLLLAGYDSLRAIDAERREVWAADAPFSALSAAAAAGGLVIVDSEGRVAGYGL